MKLLAIVLLTLSSLWAQEPKDRALELDMPRPDPVLLPVKDIGGPNAPVKCFGTVSVFYKPIPGDRMMTWVEELGLKVQNRTDKVITKMTIESHWGEPGRNHEGPTMVTVRELDFTDPRYHAPLQPGEVWVQPFPHLTGPKTKRMASDTRLSTVVPKSTAHAISVTFEDGSTYAEPEVKNGFGDETKE